MAENKIVIRKPESIYRAQGEIHVPALGAAKLSGEMKVAADAEKDAELLLIDVLL